MVHKVDVLNHEPMTWLTIFVATIVIIEIFYKARSTPAPAGNFKALMDTLFYALPFLYAGYGLLVLTTPEYTHREVTIKALLVISLASWVMVAIQGTATGSKWNTFAGGVNSQLAVGSLFFAPMIILQWKDLTS